MNKVIIVTGGSRGIGASTVKLLAKDDNKIILNYNKSEEAAKRIQKELENENIKIDIIKADVSKKAEVLAMISYVIEKYHRIDVLINNAGISQERLFTDINDEEWNEIIDVNLNSVYYCTKAVIPYMIQRKSGCIINISSIWGVTGGSCEVGYSTSKAAIIGFSKALAKEMGPSNIRINSINVSFKFYVYEKKSLQILIEKISILYGDGLCPCNRCSAGGICQCGRSAGCFADWGNQR